MQQFEAVAVLEIDDSGSNGGSFVFNGRVFASELDACLLTIDQHGPE
jgi:hypothetical protein